jgi:hypothetical protein
VPVPACAAEGVRRAAVRMATTAVASALQIVKRVRMRVRIGMRGRYSGELPLQKGTLRQSGGT